MTFCKHATFTLTFCSSSFVCSFFFFSFFGPSPAFNIWKFVFQAWYLYENNREVELLDSDLLTFNEDEVKRVIRVGLMCTQTSPARRPLMSRVVAMLCGDVEVVAITSKPGYLSEWTFDDLVTSTNDATAEGSSTTHQGSSSFSIHANDVTSSN